MAPPSTAFLYSLGHNTVGKADIAVQSVLLALVLVFVGLRVWSRRLQCLSLQWNDILILVATFFVVGRYAVEIIMVVLCGLGLHSTELAQVGGLEVWVQFNELTYAGDLLWVTAIAVIQLSILDYYVHTFGRRTMTLLAAVIMGLCVALWFASFFATAFFCTPPKKIWLADNPGHCGDRKMLNTGVNASEIILSFFVVILPIPLMWNLPLSRTRKTALVCIQVLGLAIIALIPIRAKFKSDLDPEGPPYGSAGQSMISCIVPLLGIIVACLPTLEPAIQRIFRISTHPASSPTSVYDPNLANYWKATVLSCRGVEEPEIPLVTLTQPLVAKIGYFTPGGIQVTSHWEIHSSRGSTRLDRSPVRQT
ncbi:putative integral membrane protein [Penicillium digitatum]|uniref:Putative integral membrane protein n=1 Tax=Penicillium digitatum TaxID=36651 RepID=A0A7T6XQ02_PENDI|nr:putative integral membrane protein [Penicillium digitatum]